MNRKQNFSQVGEAISNAEFKGSVITKLTYIEKSIKVNQINIKVLDKENQKRKDWQENYDTRIRSLIGVATFVGGIVVFIVDRLENIVDFIKNK